MAWAAIGFLQVYPVAGSQVSIAGVPVLIWGAICVGDGLDGCSRWLGRPRLSSAALARVAGVAAILCAGYIAVAQGPRLYPRICPASRLPGAHRLHLPPVQEGTYRFLAENIRQNCDVLFTLPGMASFNFWSSVPPPNGWNLTAWMTIFDPDHQQQILDINSGLIRFWRADEPQVRALPLGRYILEQMPAVAERNGYVIRVHPRRNAPWMAVTFVILMPVYRDWASAAAVCRALDEEFAALVPINARILLVDDASPDGLAGWAAFPRQVLSGISVLRLRTNLGHQRAICAGLCHIYEAMPAAWVLVMDCDGEDRPADAVRLIRMALDRPGGLIFAARRKRLEGLVFRAGYVAFRWLHRLLTGQSVQVGNFSILHHSVLGRLVAMPELWNHYAGAVFRSRIAFDLVPFDRGIRLHGRSHMNLPSLVAHGLAGIATFQETVATRILIANSLGASLLVLLLGTVVAIRLWTNKAIPGWATYTAGLILLLALQLVGMSFNLVFLLISNRSQMTFVPMRDYAVFVEKVVPLHVEAGSLV